MEGLELGLPGQLQPGQVVVEQGQAVAVVGVLAAAAEGPPGEGRPEIEVDCLETEGLLPAHPHRGNQLLKPDLLPLGAADLLDPEG